MTGVFVVLFPAPVVIFAFVFSFWWDLDRAVVDFADGVHSCCSCHDVVACVWVLDLGKERGRLRGYLSRSEELGLISPNFSDMAESKLVGFADIVV